MLLGEGVTFSLSLSVCLLVELGSSCGRESRTVAALNGKELGFDCFGQNEVVRVGHRHDRLHWAYSKHIIVLFVYFLCFDFYMY